jgi:signal transduction histidine kinase
VTARAKARIGLGVPAALAATWAAIPLAWNGLPGSGARDTALVAAALALSAAVAIAAATLVRRGLFARLARPGGDHGATLRAFPKAFAAVVTLASTIAALGALGVAARAAGVGAWTWPSTYGLSAAFVSLAFLVPLHLWARACARVAAEELGVGDASAGAIAARPLGGALFEWLAVCAAIVALPLADRSAHLIGGKGGGTPALVVQVVAAMGIAAAIAAIAAKRVRRGIAPRAFAIDCAPDETPTLPPSRIAEIAELDREIAGLGRRYAEALASQGALIEERRKTREKKAKVFASMSHDLRGPLNSIVGFSDLLLKGIDGELSAEQRSAVIDISREAERLLVLTGDILDTAKLDAGRFEIERVWVPIIELLTACEEGAGRFVAAKGISFRTALRPGMPPVLVDKERIVGVLLGLVSRAADAMDGGSLLLGARQVSSLEEGRDYVLLELVDEGGRADPAWREHAFDVYASLEGVAIPGENGGLALGLALVERILRLHGGELAVAAGADEPVFTVVLPLDRVDGGG